MDGLIVTGIRCRRSFDDIIEHFQGLGGSAILLNPDRVCGRDHIISAAMHAERAFANGTNRSKTMLTETILYAAGERQISKALEKMRPEDGREDIAAVVFGIADLQLDIIGAAADDSILSGTEEKAKRLGLDTSFGIPAEDLALEMVASVDIRKQ